MARCLFNKFSLAGAEIKTLTLILATTAALSGLPAELCSEDAFPASATDANMASISHRGFVDNRGETIPSNPENLPFRLVNGFPEYTIGPGDILQITTVQAGTRATEEARVLSDGSVSFSVISEIAVGGLTLSELARSLSTELALYVRNPQLQVTVLKYLSKGVSIFGSVNQSGVSLTGARFGPGVYPLEGRATALEQIMRAGGPTSDARLDQVRLIRGNRTYIIDLQRSVESGDNSQNVYLEDGDVIQVRGITQADRRVVVLGEVRQSGVFNLSSNANMLEVIAASNGFTQDARANKIRVIRTLDPVNPTVINVNAERIFKGDLSQNISVLDGDIVVVPRDFLTDLNDLLGQLSPIIQWGTIATVDPLLSVGGYDVNQSSGVSLQTDSGGNVTLSPEDQAILQQVQQNLRGTPTQGSGSSSLE